VGVAIVLLRHALRTGFTLLGSIETLSADFPECTPILCRPFFELAYRTLWAAQTDNGWFSLLNYWAQQDRAWANSAEKLAEQMDWPELAAVAKKLLDDFQLRQPRSYPDELRNFEKLTAKLSAKFGNAVFMRLEYVQSYRMMCRSSHAAFSAVERGPTAEFVAATISAVQATYVLLVALASTTLPAEFADLAKGRLTDEFLELQREIESIQLFKI
jgi:hypothetical protein